LHKSDITIKNLSKIEGHADLEVKIRDNQVKEVKFAITENKRFYTQALRNRPVIGLPQHVSRICGTCSIAHLMCAITAAEHTLGMIPSKQTKILRELAMYGLMIRDHALHLYIFSLPDEYQVDSILELNKSHHDLIHDCFDMKAAGNHLAILVAGRSVHAPYPTIGGFTHFPEKENIPKVIKELKSVRPIALKLIKIFAESKATLIRKTSFVALSSEQFSFLEGPIKSSEGYEIKQEHYFQHLHKVVIPYSEALGYEFEGKEYAVGALARLNLNKEHLNPKTQKDVASYLQVFPSFNMYHNNLAQAIEILHCIDHAIELLQETLFKEEPIQELPEKDAEGVGVIEAPRGTLYYHVKIGKDGIVKKGNIIVPTQQNQINIRDDIRLMIQENMDKSKEWISLECEKIIRAYDPCMSCASHFLKVKWT